MRVRCIKTGRWSDITFGKEYTILGTNGDCYILINDGGDRTDFYSQTLFEVIGKPIYPKFKVGDKVVDKAGDICEVEEIYVGYAVYDPKYGLLDYNEKDLKLYEEPKVYGVNLDNLSKEQFDKIIKIVE